jgi:hypothetical protein
MRIRRISAAVLALALTAGLAACSDDNDEKAVSTKDAKPAGSETAKSAAFCDGVFALDANPVPPPGSPAFPTDAAGVKGLFTPIATALDKIAESAPSGPAIDAKVLAGAAHKAVDTGEMPNLDDPAFMTHLAAIHDAVGTECDFNTLDVKGIDYAFQGIGSTVKAGKTFVSLTNATTHDEPHEIVIVRKKDGVTDSFDSLLQLPDDQAFSKVDMVTSTFAMPGGKGGITADLKAGEYLAICFVPVGGGEDGPPHFTQGMKQEFTVE